MKDKNETKTILKPYFIILLIILICSPLLKFIPILDEKITIFLDNKLRIIFGRKLNFHTDSLKVCSRSSENLAKYFETGDTQYVELYEYKNEEEPSNFTLEFIKALSGESNGEDVNNIFLAHYALASFFFLASFVAIPGWIICCSCSCCKCYCCNCLKHPKYRLPFFIISSILNCIIMITCIAGLSKTNSIFRGITNTECSILRFINEVIDGETKNTLPRWGGIDSIINMFEKTIIQIKEMGKNENKNEIEGKNNICKEIKKNFEESIKGACTTISSEPSYIYETNYKLDFAKEFGVFENDNFTDGSFADKWSKEAILTNKVEDSYNIFGQLIIGNVVIGMEKSIEFIKIMNDGIEGVKDLIGETVLEYSEMFDKYGKLVFRLVFGILLGIAVLLEFLLAIFIFFSSSKHTKCLGAFISKALIHIIWNIFALFMVIMLFFGSIIAFIGMLGSDLFQMFSFLISKRNLQSESPMILSSGSNLINACINGNGIIADELGIESDLGNIDLLKTLTNEIDSSIKIITESQGIDLVYNELLLEYEIRKDTNNFEFIKTTTDENEEKISLLDSLKSLNQKLNTCQLNERWSFSCGNDFPNLGIDECQSTTSDSNKCINPMSCNNNELNTKYSSSCEVADQFGKIVDKFISSIKYIDKSDNEKSIINQAKVINSAYKTYLTQVKEALDGYTLKFTPLTAIYDNFVGNGSIMGFINCAFLGKNVKVMLKYLDDSLGSQFKTLGITILANGVVMAFSICFIILLVIIVNSTVELRKKEKERIILYNNGPEPQIYNVNLMQRPNLLPPISQNHL
mgnify:CR=1 FL=1